MKEFNIDKLIEIINNSSTTRVMSRQRIYDDLEDLGVGSLEVMKTIIYFEEDFGIEFPESKLIFSEINSVKKIYDIVIELIDAKN